MINTTITNIFHVCCDFQPVYSIQNGVLKLSGFEALAREIDHSNNSVTLLRPQVLIDQLSSQNRLAELDLKALDDTCRFIALQIQEHPDWDIPININLSAQSLSQEHCVSIITEILQKQKINPKNVGIEIVEDSFSDNEDQILQNIYELALIGHPILIDDFGTGDSDLERIKTVQQAIEEGTDQKLTVKIDRSLTEKITKNNDFSFLEDSAFQNTNLVFEGATSKFLRQLKASKFYKAFNGDVKLQSYEMGRPRDHLRACQSVRSHQGRQTVSQPAYA